MVTCKNCEEASTDALIAKITAEEELDTHLVDFVSQMNVEWDESESAAAKILQSALGQNIDGAVVTPISQNEIKVRIPLEKAYEDVPHSVSTIQEMRKRGYSDPTFVVTITRTPVSPDDVGKRDLAKQEKYLAAESKGD